MAKDTEDKQERQDEKQIPVKPKKKSGSGGDINIFTLIGTIAGTVVLMVVIMSAAFYFFILPELKGGHGANDSTSVALEKIKEREKGKNQAKSQMQELEEEDILLGDKGVHMLETDKIVTNPKNSTQLAIVNLTIEYRISEKDERFPEGEAEITAENNPIIKKLMAGIKNEMYGIMGSLTVEEFYAIGSDSLRGKFKSELRPIFLKNKLFLRDVLITQYLIQ